jgi:hypothetical protein
LVLNYTAGRKPDFAGAAFVLVVGAKIFEKTANVRINILQSLKIAAELQPPCAYKQRK